jgi:hypothetical protein
MLRKIFLHTFLILFVSNLFGQNVNMDQRVDLNYRNVRLEDALQGISETYDIHFSYSKHYIPIDQRINIKVSQQPLSFTLDELFEETEVVYANIGDQIVLKKGKKPGLIIQKEEIYSPQYGVIDYYGKGEPVLTASTHPFVEVEEMPVLEKYNYGLPKVFSQQPEEEFDSEKYYVLAPEEAIDFSSATAQVSLVPFIGTNREEAKEKTNNISLNLLGGENGGVDGVEVGGLFNKVERDVKGVQIAGLFNSVGGDVGPSKLIDGKEKRTFGVQIAGLVNTADNVHAVQIGGLWNANDGHFKGVQFGGLFNINGEDAEGIQVGGLFNINGGDVEGVQVSGLFNINNGEGKVQVAGLTNIAGDIEGTQVSGVFNKARNVEGVQFALINVCDTVSGASIGFLNFVRRGYNQIEVGGSETMHGQLSTRFGSRRFYNILQFGVKFQADNAYGIGYGIGTTICQKQSQKWQWNAELVASQINENNQWFDKLNLLTEFRLTAEYKIGNRSSLYFGPTANLMIADILDSETGLPRELGSEVPAYFLFDNENNSTNSLDLKGWVGFRAGIRFGRN